MQPLHVLEIDVYRKKHLTQREKESKKRDGKDYREQKELLIINQWKRKRERKTSKGNNNKHIIRLRANKEGKKPAMKGHWTHNRKASHQKGPFMHGDDLINSTSKQ